MVMVDVRNHILVPRHEVLDEKEAAKVLEKLNVTRMQLPKILNTDPVVRLIKAKPGDIVKIVRDSPTAGTEVAYRMVVEAL